MRTIPRASATCRHARRGLDVQRSRCLAGPNAPTGIVFPRGTTLGAAYDDLALIGDANNGFLYKFPLNGARTGFDFTAFPTLQDLVANDTTEQNQLRIGQGFGVITDLEICPDGDLYVVSHLPGQIFRISGARPVCTPTPAICRTPAVGGRARILLKDNAADDAKDRLQWRWLKGAATDTTEFGDPINLHTYELCLYGGGSLVASATAPVDATCNGASCWRQSGRGFRYRNPTGTPDGLRTIILEAGGNGAARIVVQGKGAALAMPDLTTLASPLTVQLKRAGSTTCWGATYSFPPALRNDGAIFKDRADIITKSIGPRGRSSSSRPRGAPAPPSKLPVGGPAKRARPPRDRSG
jgi:hypothetical protein